MIEFVIVTPVFNLNEYIDQTILSVLSQAGDFTIRYHVQDGGSTDGTIDALERWRIRIEGDQFPCLCAGIRFSYDSGPDGGIYDAVRRGFARTRANAAPVIMGWINADDLLMPGGLAAVASFLRQNPKASLCGGRTAVFSSAGFLADIGTAHGYRQDDLAAGQHDGRTNHFVMQEGTFWRSELWDAVGGLSTEFRLAGDFDLWCRFAERAKLWQLDTMTAAWRQRPGQLSADSSAYYDDVDRIKAARPSPTPAPDPDGIYRYARAEERWDYQPINRPQWKALEGMTAAEGPFETFDIASGHWVVSHNARLAVWSEEAGKGSIELSFRNPIQTNRLRMAGRRSTIKQTMLRKACYVSAPFEAKRGWNPVDIELAKIAHVEADPRGLGIFITGAWFVRS